MKIEEIAVKELIKSRVKTAAGLASFKRNLAKKYKISCPSNFKLLKAYHKLVKNKISYNKLYTGQGIKKIRQIEVLLRTRPIRSLSGIVNISVLTKPYACPGKCLYCPKESGLPKSYVSGEPAVERAKKLHFNPFLQVKKRLEMLELEGHPTDKLELRIIGGTWSFYPKKYQIWFILRCFQAANQNSKNYTMVENVLWEGLRKEQKRNEKAGRRIIGLSVETRPDFINEKEIKWLRNFGVTMVELGVQSIYDDVLKLNLRGHGIKETILATRLLKDAGFKVLYQLMPNLVGSDLKKDEKMFEEIFRNPDFQPDLLKIYPCALLKEAPLYNLLKRSVSDKTSYKLGKRIKYKPYSAKQLINLIKSIKKRIPYYVRIQRIQRDIPSQKIIKGSAKISNLRQIIAAILKKESWKCKCIRCREVRENFNPKEKLYLFRQDYSASGGKEIFLSFENKNRDKLYSLLRLRIPSYSAPSNKTAGERSSYLLPILKNAAIIREIHTYGPLRPLIDIGPTYAKFVQHKGLGKSLIKMAEKIAKKEFGLKKIAAISGVGVRNYWRRLGYNFKSTYMLKKLN